MPHRIARAVLRLPDELLSCAAEIRLRLNMPASLTVGEKNIAFSETGVSHTENGLRATEQELMQCVSLISGGSFYACEDTVANGYIPVKNGRAGICGDAITSNGRITTFRSISSIDLRLHRNIKSYAHRLVDYYAKNGVCGTLVFAPPALGKTTLLRSACCLLSEGWGIRPHRVGIVDARREIYIDGMSDGFIDVVSGCSKSEGIELLTRTMAPEIIVCDELSASEAAAISEAQNTGVVLIASAHGESLEAVMRRDFIKAMFDKRIFTAAVRIERKNGEYTYEIGC